MNEYIQEDRKLSEILEELKDSGKWREEDPVWIEFHGTIKPRHFAVMYDYE